MADSVFGKIIRGEIPCHKLYEDERVLAFLDIGPLSEGHALVIPKEPAVTLDELSDESAAAVGRVLPRICRAIKRATGTLAFNVLENNLPLAHQAVPHVHFHIIPKPDEKTGLGIRWNTGQVDPVRAADLARRISADLARESSAAS
jgi:histidine triad (HIT) family protein